MTARETFPSKLRDARDRRDGRDGWEYRVRREPTRDVRSSENLELRTSNPRVSLVPLVSRGLTRPAFSFGGRWGSERIVGPGVFGIAATQFFFHFEIGRLPEAGKILGDLDGPACW